MACRAHSKSARSRVSTIRLHHTWLLAFFLIVWSLALGYFPMSSQELGPLTYWLLGVFAALLLFASVLAHELAHSLVARSRGLRVDNITLFIFGGVSSITREPASARDEFVIAFVGPLTSLLLAGLFGAIGLLLSPASAGSALAGYLAYTNFLLGVFNFVPGFPLDGGRVLRSIVWAATGNMSLATQIAASVGQAVAFVLIGWGVLRVLSGDVFGGLWIAFIGWFLNSGAEASRHEERALAGVAVSRVMDASPEQVAPDLPVREFVLEHLLRRCQRALPVVEAGHLVGMMSVTDAKHLDQEAWATTPVGEVMTPMPLRTLSPDASLAAALQLMVENGVHQLPIVQDNALVGMLSRAEVMRYMHSGLAVSERSATAQPEMTAAAPAHG